MVVGFTSEASQFDSPLTNKSENLQLRIIDQPGLVMIENTVGHCRIERAVLSWCEQSVGEFPSYKSENRKQKINSF